MRFVEDHFKYLVGAVVVVFVALIAFAVVQYYDEDTHVDCVVSSKDRTQNQDGSSDARVYTENCGTFRVGDTWIKGEFNSADTYGSIEEGETYTFTTIGWRFGLLSQFPNIIEVEEVD